jgi:hypothetical protein
MYRRKYDSKIASGKEYMSVGRLLKLIGRFGIGLMHSMRADRKKTGLCHWTFKQPSVVQSVVHVLNMTFSSRNLVACRLTDLAK